MSIDVQGVLQSLAMGCLSGLSLDADCLLAGVTADTGLSDDCAMCFVDTAICGADNCLFECIDGGQDCIDCSTLAGCTAELEICTGLEAP